MNLTANLNRLVLSSLLVSGLSAPAFASASDFSSASNSATGDLCLDSANVDRAARTLTQLKNQMKRERPDLAALVVAAGITTCNPTSVLHASLNPGEVPPHIMFAEVCGAQLLFSDAKAEHETARWILANFKSGGVCVDVDTKN